MVMEEDEPAPDRTDVNSTNTLPHLPSMKRAPSDSTVNDSLYSKSAWERSQSEANLDSFDGNGIRTDTSSHANASNRSKVSENARVYWDLPRAVEQGTSQQTSASSSRVVLETIHQREELKHFSSSSESLTRYHQQVSSEQMYDVASPGDQRSSMSKSRTGAYSRSSCIRSCERLSLNLEGDGEADEETEPSRRTASGRRVHVVRRLYHSDNDEEPTNSDDNASNYFCDSDFDDLREQRPNYLLQLEKMQAQLLKQVHIYKALASELHTEEPSAADEEEECAHIADVGRLVASATLESLCEALDACHRLLAAAWETPQSGRDAATAMCDLIRQEGLLDLLTANLAAGQCPGPLRLHSARLLSQSLTLENVSYLMGETLEQSARVAQQTKRRVEAMVRKMWEVRENVALNREMIMCLESMFKHSEKTSRRVIAFGGLKSVIFACRSLDKPTLRHAAIALANLSLYGCTDTQAEMIRQRVADWLFPLAFSRDDIVHYYACLAIVVLSTNRELAQAVDESGTLKLVLPFVQQQTPRRFAASEPSHYQGRSKGWLQRLVPTLKSEREEVQALAAFHFAMEAIIKRQQNKTEIFRDIGAVEVLRHVASVPNAISSRLAAQALQSMGEEVPYTLSPQVPLWTEEDVQFWLTQIGLQAMVPDFQSNRVDGDLLLLLTDAQLQTDLNIENGLARRRFLRELRKLRQASNYNSVDPSQLDPWLRQHVGREFGQYTYNLLSAGVDRQFLPQLTNDQLLKDCCMNNGVHRAKILHCIEACKRHRQTTSESSTDFATSVPSPVAISAPIAACSHGIERSDVFISYRRSTGSQLASLLKVHLQLRGYRVFLDIEKLTAGRFDESLLTSVRISKNFVIVCTPGSLDRCLGDDERKDWVHKEIVTALEAEVNIIPITDRFEWPVPDKLPADMRAVVKYNGIKWIHEYQEACIDRLEKFLVRGELSPFSTPSMLQLTGAFRRISTPESAQSMTSTPPTLSSRPMVDSIQESESTAATETSEDPQ